MQARRMSVWLEAVIGTRWSRQRRCHRSDGGMSTPLSRNSRLRRYQSSWREPQAWRGYGQGCSAAIVLRGPWLSRVKESAMTRQMRHFYDIY